MQDVQISLRELTDVVARLDDFALACTLACERLHLSLGGPVAILERAGERWRLVASSPSADGGQEEEGVSTDSTISQEDVFELAERAGALRWAWVPLSTSEERVLLVPAEWHEHDAARTLEQVARPLGLALEAVTLRDHRRRTSRAFRATYGFARRLGMAPRGADLHQVIVDDAARAVRAGSGALALFSEADGFLRINATSGYPRVLVEDVRIRPGEGVIGRVFESRRPLLVSDLSRHPQMHAPRPRYRTTSFMAVPICTPGAALGVVCTADRLDGAPFDKHDLQVLRALTAPAALALHTDHLAEQAELLGEWATIDPLTVLFNRRYFWQRLEEELQRARRYNLPLSLLLLDIDDFKRVNDAYGHPAGDAVLRGVGDSLRQAVRAFDICSRYGGEEFSLLLPGSGLSDAITTAHRVREAVEVQRFALSPNHAPVLVTASIGVATLARNETSGDLIARADAALYEAKAAGKNQVQVAGRSTP